MGTGLHGEKLATAVQVCPCERGERRKENVVERPSDSRAALRKSCPDGWAVPVHIPIRKFPC